MRSRIVAISLSLLAVLVSASTMLAAAEPLGKRWY
jgi:hypothetical protein